MNETLEKLLSSALTHDSDWEADAQQFKEGIKEIHQLLERRLDAKLLMEALAFFDACEETIIDVRARMVTGPSKVNNDLFYNFCKFKYTQKIMGISVLADGVLVAKDFDTAIGAMVDDLFKSLNQSTDNDRFHKAICLRRDVKRLKIALEDPYAFNLGVDWTVIEPKEDYIEDSTDLDFLKESRERLAVNETSYEFWAIENRIRQITSENYIRRSFLERLGLYYKKD